MMFLNEYELFVFKICEVTNTKQSLVRIRKMTQAGFNLRNLMRRAVGKSMSKQVQPSPDQTKK